MWKYFWIFLTLLFVSLLSLSLSNLSGNFCTSKTPKPFGANRDRTEEIKKAIQMSATTTGPDSAASPPSSRVGRANSDGIIDTTPLLPSGVSRAASVDGENGIQRSARRQGLREAARFLRHAGSRRMMREPSVMVRETAAEQLEERQSDWAYSKPVVFLDILWNLAFVAIGVAVLILSRDERPNVPLRVWVVGYGVQCGLHMACVCVEYRRRRCRRRSDTRHGSSASSSPSSTQQYVSLSQLEDTGSTR